MGQPPQARHVAGFCRLGLDHGRQHGRHRNRARDLFGLDEIERDAGVEGRLDHVGGTDPDHRQGAIHPGRVEHGRHREITVIFEEGLSELGVHGVGHQVGVGQHHALGRTGGAAGVEEACQGVWRDSRFSFGSRCQQVFVLTSIDADHTVDNAA